MGKARDFSRRAVDSAVRAGDLGKVIIWHLRLGLSGLSKPVFGLRTRMLTSMASPSVAHYLSVTAPIVT